MIVHETEDREEMFRASKISDLFLTTANSTVKLADMSLVMGAGHAKQFLDYFDPGGSKMLAKTLALGIHELAFDYRNMGNYDIRPTVDPYIDSDSLRVYYPYGVLRSFHWPKSNIGLFQTKDRFDLPSRLDIISWSLAVLKTHMRQMKNVLGHDARVDMPFPGIGLGGLNDFDVLPLLERFGDNLHIWRLKE